MVVYQQSLLEDKARLEELHRSYDGEARLNESFIVLTIGASLIASPGFGSRQQCCDHRCHGCGSVDPAAAGGGVRDSDRSGQAFIPTTNHPCRLNRDHVDPVDGIRPNRTQ